MKTVTMNKEKIKQALVLAKSLSDEKSVHTDVEPSIRLAYTTDALRSCVQIIDQLMDENESVWELIEEIKKSEIKNHKESIEKELNRKMMELEQLVLTKPEEC